MKHSLLSAVLVTGAAFLFSATAGFAQTYSYPSSSSDTSLPCGPLTMMCVYGTQAQCIDHQWQCVPTSSSSSSSSSSARACEPNTFRCHAGTDPLCSNGRWTCVQSSSSSSSSESNSCGANTLFCAQGLHPVCENNQWTCQTVPGQDRCGANTLFCAQDFFPVCTGTTWTCLPRSGSSSSSSVAPSTIHLTSLTPDSGPSHTRVTIEGTGFARRGNIVTFAGSSVIRAASRDGTHITFRVPAFALHSCFLGLLQCPASPKVTYGPGTYDVSVYLKNQEASNALQFTVK